MRFNEILESAVEELKRELPSLKKPYRSTIGQLIDRISRRYRVEKRDLHKLFVNKYGESPDHWISKYQSKLAEDDSQEYVLFLNNKPAAKYTDIYKAQQDLAYIKKKFPKQPAEIKQQVCRMEPLTQKLGEEIENQNHKEQVEKFIEWSAKKLNLQTKPKIILSNDTKEAQTGTHTGRHEGDNIWVYIGNRNLIDIFRTIFHELVHHRQHELNMIKDGDSYPGSPIEAMADMLAGKYIKIYGKQHPEIFQ